MVAADRCGSLGGGAAGEGFKSENSQAGLRTAERGRKESELVEAGGPADLGGKEVEGGKGVTREEPPRQETAEEIVDRLLCTVNGSYSYSWSDGLSSSDSTTLSSPGAGSAAAADSGARAAGQVGGRVGSPCVQRLPHKIDLDIPDGRCGSQGGLGRGGMAVERVANGVEAAEGCMEHEEYSYEDDFEPEDD